MTLIFPLIVPEVLSILKLGSKETLILVLAEGSSECVSSLTAKGGLTLRVKFKGKFDPLVSASSFSMGTMAIFLSQKYLK